MLRDADSAVHPPERRVRGWHLAGHSQAFAWWRGAPGRRLIWSPSRARAAAAARLGRPRPWSLGKKEGKHLPSGPPSAALHSHGFAVPVHFAHSSTVFQAEGLVEAGLGIIARAFGFWQKEIRIFFFPPKEKQFRYTSRRLPTDRSSKEHVNKKTSE